MVVISMVLRKPWWGWNKSFWQTPYLYLRCHQKHRKKVIYCVFCSFWQCHKYISSRGVRDSIIYQVVSCSSSIYTVIHGAVWGLDAVLYDLMLCPFLRPGSLQLLFGVRYCSSILLPFDALISSHPISQGSSTFGSQPLAMARICLERLQPCWK